MFSSSDRYADYCRVFCHFCIKCEHHPPSARKGLGIQEGGMVEIAGCISHSPGCEPSLWYDQRCLEDMSTITNQEPLQPQTILPNHPPPLSASSDSITFKEL